MIDIARIKAAIEQSGTTVPAILMLVENTTKAEADARAKAAEAEARATEAEAKAMSPEVDETVGNLVAHLEQMTASMADTLAKHAPEEPAAPAADPLHVI